MMTKVALSAALLFLAVLPSYASEFDEATFRIEYAAVQAGAGASCPGAHFYQSAAREALMTLQTAGRYDKAMYDEITRLTLADFDRDWPKGGEAYVCNRYRALTSELPNPFLTFER